MARRRLIRNSGYGGVVDGRLKFRGVWSLVNLEWIMGVKKVGK